jgi:factor associated with neutral sphingomyelinase activation
MLEGDNSHPPFLYGTHYSTPGYVLYWLVRAAPAHMLRLQNGRFDAPDRLFASVADSWESVLNNPADLKELIPEFFAPPSDFLVKREGLNLGVRQNGVFVGDVMLPAW